MKFHFPYFEKDGQWLPVIEVTLRRARQHELKVQALVDSGASFSVFHPEVAQYLGINIERGKKIFLTGIGGRILGYIHALSITVGGKTFRCRVVFSPEFTVSFNLLGRDDFFLPFIISFSEKEREVILEETSK